MSPTPVTMASPVATYTWEATDEQVAARYGIPLERVARFDLNTAPIANPAAARVLASGAFVKPVSEYPPSDYRALAAVAAEVYGVAPDEVLVGAGADEVLDLCAKAFLAAGDAAVLSGPTYAMHRVVTEQRGGRVVAVPRLPASAGYASDVAALRAAAREARASLVWLCDPNNPTGLAEPDGAVATLLDGLLADAASDGRMPPAVVLDEAYAEFTGRSAVALRSRYPRLVVVRTASKAYALAGLRVGFALAVRDTLAEIEPYRPPGSVSVLSVSVVTDALRDRAWLADNVARLAAERERLAAALADAGWRVRPSVTNFLLVDFGSVERAAAAAEALLRRGLVPRTFGPGHPLADHLRITVRWGDENERLIAAAREIETETAGMATTAATRPATTARLARGAPAPGATGSATPAPGPAEGGPR